MNPLGRNNNEATIAFCSKTWTGFKTVKPMIEKYQQMATLFENRMPNKLQRAETSSSEESQIAREIGTPGQFNAYIEQVFEPIFLEHPPATAGIRALREQLNNLSGIQMIRSIDLPQISKEMRDVTPLEPDFVTLILSLSAAHLFEIRNKAEGDQKVVAPGSDQKCPVCGLKSHYAILANEEGARLMECWLCRTRWSYPRLVCSFCQEKQQEKLGYFTTEEIPGCRIHFCRECRTYLKVFDLRERSLHDPNLWVMHLASLFMDDLAALEGFDPASGMIWNHSGAVHQEPTQKESMRR